MTQQNATTLLIHRYALDGEDAFEAELLALLRSDDDAIYFAYELLALLSGLAQAGAGIAPSHRGDRAAAARLTKLIERSAQPGVLASLPRVDVGSGVRSPEKKSKKWIKPLAAAAAIAALFTLAMKFAVELPSSADLISAKTPLAHLQEYVDRLENGAAFTFNGPSLSFERGLLVGALIDAAARSSDPPVAALIRHGAQKLRVDGQLLSSSSSSQDICARVAAGETQDCERGVFFYRLRRDFETRPEHFLELARRSETEDLLIYLARELGGDGLDEKTMALLRVPPSKPSAELRTAWRRLFSSVLEGK